MTNGQVLTIAFSGFGLGVLAAHLFDWHMRRLEAKIYFRWKA